MEHASDLDLVHGHARLEAKRDRARLSDEEAEIAAGGEAEDDRRVREAVRNPTVDVRDQRGDRRGRAESAADEEAEQREAQNPRFGLLVQARGVALDDSRVGAHLAYQSADRARDLRAFHQLLKDLSSDS